VASIVDQENLIKQFYFLSSDKKLREFREANPVQKTLREKLKLANETIFGLN
jgi:hypothetical protein